MRTHTPIFFENWLSLVEGMGQLEYVPPKDAKTLIYDFYLVQQLMARPSQHTDRQHTDELYKDLDIAYKKLVPDLKDHLLEKVSNSLLSEIKHYFTQVSRSDGSEEMDEILYASGRTRDGRDAPSPDEMAKLVPVMKKMFSRPGWRHMYGGKPWAKACQGWLNLYNAQSLGSICVWIDHIYDLQHNTGSLLNKNPEYRGEWVHRVLDLKRDARSFEWLMHGCSSWMNKMAHFMIYAQERRGFSDEEYQKGIDYQAGPKRNNQHHNSDDDDSDDDDEEYGRPRKTAHERTERELQKLADYWNRKLTHSSVNFEAVDDEYFTFDGNMTVTFDNKLFAGGKMDMDEVDKDDLVDHLNRAKHFLHSEHDPVQLAQKFGVLYVYINFTPEDESGGGESEFSNLCNSAEIWDNDYDNVREDIAEFFRMKGVMPLSASRKALADHATLDSSPWKHFQIQRGKPGEFIVLGKAEVGSGKHLPTYLGKTSDPKFNTYLKDMVYRKLEDQIENQLRSHKRQPSLPEIEVDAPVIPVLPEIQVWLNNTHTTDVADEFVKHFDLNIRLSVEDEHAEEEVEDFQTTVNWMDKFFPQYVIETNQMLQAYDQQVQRSLSQAKTQPGNSQLDTYTHKIGFNYDQHNP